MVLADHLFVFGIASSGSSECHNLVSLYSSKEITDK